jgi:hypothetical protein
MTDPEIADPLPPESRAKAKAYVALVSLAFGLLGGAIGAVIVWRTLSAKISNLENGVAYHEMVVENLRNIHWVSKDPDNYVTIKPGDTKPCRPGSVAAGAAMAAQGQQLDLYCVELIPRR